MKKLFYIILFFIGLTFTSFAQTKTVFPDDPAAKLIKFYPNPATTSINFEFQRSFDKSISFEIYSFIGKRIYEIKAPSLRITIDLNDFFRGIYYYKVVDKSGRIMDSGKFLVIK